MNPARIKDWILQIALALLIFFGFLRPYVVEAFRIPTPSMEETLLVGDHLLVLKAEEGQRIPGPTVWSRWSTPSGATRWGC